MYTRNVNQAQKSQLSGLSQSRGDAALGQFEANPEEASADYWITSVVTEPYLSRTRETVLRTDPIETT
jgi:hypothetical protein